MLMIGEQPQLASPMRLLEMLADRFGAFEAVANSTIKLARYAPEDELSMDVQLAEAVLEFGSDLREAAAVALAWADANGLIGNDALSTDYTASAGA
jgi:hypothetical protein